MKERWGESRKSFIPLEDLLSCIPSPGLRFPSLRCIKARAPSPCVVQRSWTLQQDDWGLKLRMHLGLKLGPTSQQLCDLACPLASLCLFTLLQWEGIPTGGVTERRACPSVGSTMW